MKQVASGFTIVELMTTLTVSSILLGVGVPSLTNLLDHYHTEADVQQLRQTIWMARSHSISYRARATLCHLEHNSCTSTNWQQGITLFVDKNGDYQLSDTEPVLFKSGPLTDGATVSFNRRAIRFLPTGLASGMNGTLQYCPENDAVTPQAIVVNQAGRTRLTSSDGC